MVHQPGWCCVLLITPAAVCLPVPPCAAPMLLLLPDSVWAALDSGVTAVRSWCSWLELAVGGPCSKDSGTSCWWCFHSLENMRRAADAEEPSAASPLLCCASAVEEELRVCAALLLDEVPVCTDSSPAPAAAAAGTAPGLLRGMNSGTMSMTTLSPSAPVAGDGPAAGCMPPAVLLLDAAWLAVVLLLGRLADPELWRPACLDCGPLRGELTAAALRCSAACRCSTATGVEQARSHTD